MKHGFFWRIPLSLLALFLSVYFLLPDIFGVDMTQREPGKPQTGIARFLPNSHISLGLDLRGGIHLTLGVDTAKAVSTALEQAGQDMLIDATDNKLLITTPVANQQNQLELILTQPDKKIELEDLFSKAYQQFEVLSAQTLPDNRIRYTLDFKKDEKKRLEEHVVDQALKTIRNRIDQFGVAEPDIRKQQGDRIVVQLPGMDNTQRAVKIIGKTAHLEFRLVRNNVDMSRAAPVGVEFLPLLEKDPNNTTQLTQKIAVETQIALTGDRITNSAVQFSSEDGSPYVGISFDKRGSEIFARLTGEHIGSQLAIVLDGVVHSAPVIRAKIEGSASITGNFTVEEATDLALVLRAGSLPAPVKVLEERSVGPSLGQESIKMGVTAAAIGGLFIIVFMTIYYGWSGVIANLMLIFDILLILAGMACFGATLTLPGIAGIVLTIGMAVDANVLVFERIREELAKGLTPVAAINTGFSRASLAIIDSNLTTVIAAAILYQFGTGPIRGFAVTLVLGIIASMFTAIFVSHLIYDLWMRKPGRKLSI